MTMQKRQSPRIPRENRQGSTSRSRRLADSFILSDVGELTQSFPGEQDKNQIVITPDPTGTRDIWDITVQDETTDPVTYPAVLSMGVVVPTNTELLSTEPHGKIDIKNKNGSEIWTIDQDGMRFRYQADLEITTNATLNQAYLGKFTAINKNTSVIMPLVQAAGSGPQDSDGLGPGAWMGFYDLSGSAGANPISINTGVAGFTINDNSGITNIIDSDYGVSILLYDVNSVSLGNWILIKIAGATPGSSPVNREVITVTNTDHTVVPYKDIVLVSTGNSARTITLPDVAIYEDSTVIVKKIDSGTGSVMVQPAVNTVNLEDRDDWTLAQRYSALEAVSDGSDWWIIRERTPVDSEFLANRLIEVGTNTATVARENHVVLVNTNATVTTLTLPKVSATFRRMLTIKKTNNGAGNVLIQTQGGDTIEGLSNTTLVNNSAAITLWNDKTKWQIVSRYLT